MSIAQDLSAKIVALGWADLETDAVAWAKIGILDTIGVALAGASESCSRIALSTLCPEHGAERQDVGPSLVLASGRRARPLDAAMLNGIAAHALDFDDCSNTLGGHPSAPVMPALLLALADDNALAGAVTGRDFILAYLVGYETACAVARGVNFHHYDKGWHPTATLGTIGAAAACGKLLALDADRLALALAIAVSLSSGVKANFGTMTKPLHIGHANRNGLLAAFMARDGFTANREAFEHGQGFLDVFNGTGTYDAAAIVEKFATPFDIIDPGLIVKQYPCCASTHSAIDVLAGLRADHDLDPGKVETILAWLHPHRLVHVDRPDPRGPLDAKFSLQYVLARTLIDGRIRLDHFDGDAYDDPEVRAVMAKIVAAPHPAPEAVSEERYLAEIRVKVTGGEEHRAALSDALGASKDMPLPPDAVPAKFEDCAVRYLPPDRIGALADAVDDLDRLDDVRSLGRMIERPTAPSSARSRAAVTS